MKAKCITVVEPRGEGLRPKVYVHAKRKKKSKVQGPFKAVAKRRRRHLKAIEVFAGELQRRDQQSNRKRRNGFLRDGRRNLARSLSKALREL